MNGESKSVVACDTQPVTVEGLRTLLRNCPDIVFTGATGSIEALDNLIRVLNPAVLVLDKALGLPVVVEQVARLRDHYPDLGVVVWGVSMTDAEALRLLQAGARGILRKTAETTAVMACLRTVASGSSWMEDNIFRESASNGRYPRSELTPRERQVMELIEQGLKNREIASELGIRPGTVKIHLKHIFEKTGVRGRYGLALTGLKDRGLISLPEM